jgi:exosortase
MGNTALAWWTSADAGHGLLLAPLALWLCWRGGVVAGARGQPVAGIAILAASVVLRYLSALAAELFTMRLSVLGALLGLVVFTWGVRQVLHWWLPGVLLLLAMPLPELVLSSLALPLQFQASRMGAALLEARHVPVALSGNIIHLPGGHQLFVTEACSGLRSLSALIALGVLIGGIGLRSPWGRGVLALIAIPIAMVLNAMRIFVTGFSVHFIDPALGDGLMHYTEGWVMFVAALAVLGSAAWVLSAVEARARTVEAVA